MTGALRLQEPFISGSRKIYPVVAEVSWSAARGMTAMISPVAVIIEEDGRFSGAVFEEGSLEHIIGRLIKGETPV
jgi:hypothetical protein